MVVVKAFRTVRCVWSFETFLLYHSLILEHQRSIRFEHLSKSALERYQGKESSQEVLQKTSWITRKSDAKKSDYDIFTYKLTNDMYVVFERGVRESITFITHLLNYHEYHS